MSPSIWFPILIVFAIILYVNFKLNISLYQILERRRLHKLFIFEQKVALEKRLALQKATIKTFLEQDLEEFTQVELENIISTLSGVDYKDVLKEFPYVKDKLKLANFKFEEFKIKNRCEELENHYEELKDSIDNLDRYRKLSLGDDEERLEVVKSDLDIDNNHVYSVESLNNEQIQILKDEGFEQFNEYDLECGSVISAMIKPVMNHSATHTFLVWSATRLIRNSFDDIENLKTHDTKDADITFKYHGKYYAIEIETGSLLKKQSIFAEKVSYLNHKYGNRWLFIVSNKNLVAKYKKYGFATQRKLVYENIKKMLENKHSKKSGGKSKASSIKTKKKSSK